MIVSYWIEVIDEGFIVKRDKFCIFDMLIFYNLYNICIIIFFEFFYLNIFVIGN